MHATTPTPSPVAVRPRPAFDDADSLARVLAYENDAIVHKFLERFDVPFEEARALFQETKKWMWLAGRPDRPARLMVTEDLLILDEMWHTFILFTRDYAEFCRDHIGFFVHHAPTRKSEKDQLEQEFAEDPEGVASRSREELHQALAFIARHLGGATVHRWFVEFPLRYGAAFFTEAQRPVVPSRQPELLAALTDVDHGYRAGQAPAP